MRFFCRIISVLVLFSLLGGKASLADPRGVFPFGIWLQNPIEYSTVYDGISRSHAELMSIAGINVLFQMYGFPETTATYFPGFNEAAMDELVEWNIRFVSGYDDATVQYFLNHEEYEGIHVAYNLYDEPDMNPNHPDASPSAVNARAAYLHSVDDEMISLNVGKFIGQRDHYYNSVNPPIGELSGKVVDFAEFTENDDLVSTDVYYMTDGYNVSSNYVGIWGYGDSGRVLREFAALGSQVYPNYDERRRAFGIYVETGQPFTHNDGLYPNMPMELLDVCFWNAIIAGHSDYIVLFPQDHYTVIGPDGVDTDPNYDLFKNQEVFFGVKDAIASVNPYARVLGTHKLDSVSVQSTGPVEVAIREHDFTDDEATVADKWIFAMAHGSPEYINSAAVVGTFQVPNLEVGLVTVKGENRTIPLVNGEFTDFFDPYERHVYFIQGAGLLGGNESLLVDPQDDSGESIKAKAEPENKIAISEGSSKREKKRKCKRLLKRSRSIKQKGDFARAANLYARWSNRCQPLS